jgi:hypothetical protein
MCVRLSRATPRDYSNVTLHLARGTGLGKNGMIERIKERWPRVQRGIEEALGPERSVSCACTRTLRGSRRATEGSSSNLL